MNLSEIQHRARDYRILLSNPKMLREQRKLQTSTQPAERATRKPRRDLSERAHELLDGIDAISCLEAIRDEAWHEGKIVELGRTMIGGRDTEWVVRLESDPFDEIQVIMDRGDRQGMIEKVQLKQGATYLGVAVRLQTDRVFEVAVGNERIYSINANSALDFKARVKIYGTFTTWPVFHARLGYPEGTHFGMNWSDSFNPKRAFAQDELCLRLDDSLRIREATNSFPSQTRQWCDEVVKQFPQSLKDRGEMTSEELREWGYEIREIPRWLRFLDRRLRFLT